MWNWGWTMAEENGLTSNLQLNPDTMDFVRIWVDVPQVIDGAPLANQGPTFRLIGSLASMAQALLGISRSKSVHSEMQPLIPFNLMSLLTQKEIHASMLLFEILGTLLIP